MKIPLSWLREYVDFDDTASGLADKLTFSGIEVEGITRVREGFDQVIAGQIINVAKHPGADKLQLCDVSDGVITVKVVCGATNMKTGDKAAFAPCGTTLPGGFKIKKAKIRGEESFGMLCAEDELGLSDDHSGIIILDSEIEVGQPLSKLFGEPDEVLDLEITWNRPDCLSVIGIAREVAALYGTKLKIPEISLKDLPTCPGKPVAVSIDDFQACPRYIGRYLANIKVGPSPLWMKARLAACGLRPINNIVDITNYVLLETGHPLHAFDYTRVKEGAIKVRYAGDAEQIRTLDGAEQSLGPDVLVISDSDRALAVAGIMGGDESQIADGTTEVFLESASFNPAVIHKAVVKLGTSTESSHRFERGVDYVGVEFASGRAAAFMCEYAEARLGDVAVDCNDGAPALRRVKLSIADLSAVIGVEIPAKEAREILDSLQFVINEAEGGFDVTVPGFRPDVEIQADLIEEIARMKGLDSVPAIPPFCPKMSPADDRISWKREELRDSLVALGLTEVVNYSFTSPRLSAVTSAVAEGVNIPNPVSADYSVMRGSLSSQMIDLIGRNLSHQQLDCACFEIGKVFDHASGMQISESEHLCIGLTGKVGRYTLDRVSKAVPEEVFQWGKGIIENVFSRHNLSVHLECHELSLLAPGSAVKILLEDGSAMGWMGLLCDELRTQYRMLEPVFLAEFALSPLLTRDEPCPAGRPVPVFPFVTRDVAVVVNESVNNGDIVSAIRSINCPHLTRIELFDIFRGEGTGNGKKSMAYSLTFQALEKTLTDEEVNNFRDKVRDVLVSKLDAEIREG